MKAILFDFDGTLCNTLPLCIAAFRKAVEPLAGKHLSDADIIATFGPSEEGTVQSLAPEHYDQALEDYLKYYRELHPVMCPAPFDGVNELIAWLKSRGVRLALVTGKGRRSCDISLELLGMTHDFEMIETGWRYGPRKAACIRTVLESFALPPGEALYVGDSVSDIAESRAVGIPVAAAAWAETADIPGLTAARPDQLFTSIPAFRKWLEDTLEQFQK